MHKYLGTTTDNSGRTVHGYLFNEAIYITYNKCIEDNIEDLPSRTIEELKKNPDKYIWTPFIDFV